MRVIRTIHPVGQGAFYSERFFDGNRVIGNVVYDCGSVSPSLVISEIDATYNADERIDALFLSHLDRDHINGIPYLAKFCKIDRIFFPIIDSDDAKYTGVCNMIPDEERLNADPNGEVLRFLKRFPVNPTEAFEAIGLLPDRFPRLYGVNIEHEQNNNENGSSDEIFLNDNYPQTYDEIITQRRLISSPPEYTAIPDNGNVGEVLVINSGAVLGDGWFGAGNQFYWRYIPYNFRRKRALAELRRAMRDYLGLIPDIDDIREIIINPAKSIERKRLKEAYDRVGGGINSNSMIVLSGDSSQYIQRTISPNHSEVFYPEGALYMGDYDSRSDQKYRAVLRAYRAYWNNVGVLQIPHHGSENNYNTKITKTNRCYFISADPLNNNYKHPSDAVIDDLDQKRREYYIADKATGMINEVTSIDEYMQTHFRGVGSFNEMLDVEMMREDIMNNLTSRRLFDYLCGIESVRIMIAAILHNRPPFEAVVEDIEAICNLPGSTLRIDRENDHWHIIHNSLGKMVSYVLGLYEIRPARVFDGEGNVVNGRYIRRKLKKGTQFGTAVVFEIRNA